MMTFSIIGANALGKSTDERSDYFLSRVLELQLCVANTFGPYSPEWGWTRERYGVKRLKNQIDFVLVPPSLVHNTSVLYQIDCASDHKPICSYVDTPAPSPPPPARKRSLKGWQPKNPEATEHFRQVMNELPSGCKPSDIHDAFKRAVSSTPHTTSNQRSRNISLSFSTSLKLASDLLRPRIP